MTESLQGAPANSEKLDTETDRNRTTKTRAIGHPFSACVWEVFQAEPDRTFHVRDVVEKTGGKVDTVNRICSRLYEEEKLLRLSQGFYKYNPMWEEGNLMALARAGEWKIENLTFVRKGARGTSGQPAKTVPDDPNRTIDTDSIGQELDTNWTPPDTSMPVPQTGYPWNLATGQEVFRGTYDSNGTEIIRVSANGRPPISLDLGLQLITSFQMDKDEWRCSCIEVNKDNRTRKFEGTYTMQAAEAVLIKAYQHQPGDTARLEIANRRAISLREVTDLFNYLDAGISTTALNKSVGKLSKQVSALEKSTRYAENTIAKLQDRRPRRTSAPKKQKPKREASRTSTVPVEPPPAFTTGAELRRQPAPAAGPGESA